MWSHDAVAGFHDRASKRRVGRATRSTLSAPTRTRPHPVFTDGAVDVEAILASQLIHPESGA
jgi:hypothetical protein